MKKMTKKVVATVLLCALVLSSLFCGAAFAADITVYVDGVKLPTDVPPTIVEGRTMIPVRAVSEAVGCRVEWVPEYQSVLVYSPAGGDLILVMTVNDPYVKVNSYNGNTGTVSERMVLVDVPPVNLNGRVLVPLRFIAETIGFTVEWDEASQTVFLVSALYEQNFNAPGAAGNANECGFVIYNESDYEIYAVYISPVNSPPSDEMDILPNILGPGENYYFNAKMPAQYWGVTDWVMSVVDVDGDSSVSYEAFNPFKLTYVDIEWHGEAGHYICKFFY